MNRDCKRQATETCTAPEPTVEMSDPVECADGVERRLMMRPEDLQVAHELRTPLTALKSSIDLLCQGDLSADDARIARIAQRNVERMVEIVEAMVLQRRRRS